MSELRSVDVSRSAQIELAAAVTLAAWVGLLACFGLDNNDTWWHLATGRLIWETGDFPTADPYSHLAEGAPWVAEYWLFQLGLLGLWKLGGPVALTLFKTAWIVALVIGIGSSLHRRGVPWSITALAAFPTLMVMSDRMTVRPELVTWAGIGMFLCLLPRGVAPPRRATLIALPLVQVFWTNCHPAFLVGPVIVCMTAFGQGVNSLWRREMRALGPLFRAYALLLGLVLLATLVNPYGYRLHLLPFQLTDTEAFLKHILEWNTPALARNVVYRNVAMVLGVITAVPLIMSLRRRETVLLIWFLAFAFLGTRAVRHSAIFALVSLVVIAEGAGMGWSARSARTRSVVGIVAITLMALLVLLTLTGWLWWMWGSYRRVGLHPYPWRFSESGAEFVERVKPEGKMFNDYNLGGYLLWELYPEYQVAIDGRLIVYGGELVDTTLSIVNVQRPWEPFFQEHDIHWAFLANEAEQLIHALWVHPDWSLVHVDARSVVFVDRHGRNATIADEFGLAPGDLEPLAQIAPVPRGPRWMAPPVPYESVRRVKLLFMLGRAELASRVNEAQHAATPKDPSVNTERPATLLHAARIHMRLENWPEAEQALRTLVEVDEASRDGWNNLGVLMARTGQPEKAQAAWERALELDPANAAIRQNLERLTAQQASGETPLNRTIGTDQDPNPLFPTQPSLE